MQVFLILLTYTLIQTVQSEIEIQRVPKPCQVLLDCPFTGETAYATDGKTCFVFRNNCFLRNENCRRHNVYFRTLEPISSTDCRNMCNVYCKSQGIQLCLTFEGHFATVESYCEWNRKMCETTKYWNFVHGGACLEDLEPN